MEHLRQKAARTWDNWMGKGRGRGEGKEGVHDDWCVSGCLGRWQSHVEQKERRQEDDEFNFRHMKFLALGDIMWKLLRAPGSPHPKLGETTEPETGISLLFVVPLLTVSFLCVHPTVCVT